MHVVSELHSVAGFLESRRSLRQQDGSDPADAVAFRLATSISDMIARLPGLSTHDGDKILGALKVSAFSDEHASLITAAVDSRLGGVARTTTGRKTTQLIEHVVDFFTERDWSQIESETLSLQQKIQVMVHRLSRCLGVTNPHERSLRWMVAILVLSHYENLPKYKVIFSVLGDIKEEFEVQNSCFQHGHLIRYPDSPAGLSKPRYDHAYGDDDKPVLKHIDRLRNVAIHHVPLRKNSKLLTKEAEAEAKGDSLGIKDLLGGIAAMMGKQQEKRCNITLTGQPTKGSDCSAQQGSDDAGLESRVFSILQSLANTGRQDGAPSKALRALDNGAEQGARKQHTAAGDVNGGGGSAGKQGDPANAEAKGEPVGVKKEEVEEEEVKKEKQEVKKEKPAAEPLKADAFEQAAITAFRARAIAAKAKAKAKAKDKKAAVHEGTKRKPAAASSAAKKVAKEEKVEKAAVKEEKAAVKVEKANPTPAPKGVPPCPTAPMSKATLYKCGKIYATKHGCYRVILDVNTPSLERRIAYEDNKNPDLKGWRQAMKLINEYSQ